MIPQPHGEATVAAKQQRARPEARTKRYIDLSAPATLKRIERLARYLNQDQIADVLGIDDRTLRQKMHDSPSVRAAYQKGKQSAVKDVAKSLVQNARKGNVIAQIFYLKTQGRWREKDKEGDAMNAHEQAQRIKDALRDMDQASGA